MNIIIFFNIYIYKRKKTLLLNEKIIIQNLIYDKKIKFVWILNDINFK